MNQEFLRPRLIGKRFDEHTLPLDILKDFSALEEMLIEVAKHQYLAAHLDRQRTPKGFTKGLELHLTTVEKGSTIPVIALVFSTLFPSPDADYFHLAKNQIIEAIAAAGQGRLPVLSSDLLRYFDRFGRGLHEGEAMEFTSNNGQTATLTPAIRQRLLRASQAETWTEEVTLKGRIAKVDQSGHSFELELRDGTKLKSPLMASHQNTVVDALRDYGIGTMVAVKGVIQRDRADRPKCFELIEHVTSLDSLDIENRLEELAQLKDGWFDGKGHALDKTALIHLTWAFDEHFSPELPLPYIYPTPEGGVQAEWTLNEWEISLEISFPSLAAEYQAVHIVNGETREQALSLTTEDNFGWITLNDALTQLQEAS